MSLAINCKAKLILEEEYPELLPDLLGFLAVKQSTGTSALSELRPWLSPNAPPLAAAARSAISPGSCDPEPEESEFGGRVSERLEVVRLRLVGENIPVAEKQDSLLRARFPQPPDDLKCGVGFAGAGGHHQQDAILAARDGFYGAIDSDELVVARGFAGTILVVFLRGYGFLRCR